MKRILQLFLIKNSYRNISISDDTAEVIKAQREKVNSEYVFPSPNGGPISPDSVNHMLQRVLERAGLPKVRFHDLRHTFATIALQNGVDIKTVSGMKQARTTKVIGFKKSKFFTVSSVTLTELKNLYL